MSEITSNGDLRPNWATVAAIAAVIFGGATILFGGRVLFGGTEVRAALGDIVPFVLWFNFVAGFAYVLAGIGLFLWKRWAAELAALIAGTTALAILALGLHIAMGGAFELRTVGALVLRASVWTVIALHACQALGCRLRPFIGS